MSSCIPRMKGKWSGMEKKGVRRDGVIRDFMSTDHIQFRWSKFRHVICVIAAKGSPRPSGEICPKTVMCSRARRLVKGDRRVWRVCVVLLGMFSLVKFRSLNWIELNWSSACLKIKWRWGFSNVEAERWWTG